MVDIFFILVDLDLLESFFASTDLRENKHATEEYAEESIVTIEKIIFTTETSSKIHKLSLYKETMSEPMHTR